MQQSLSKRLDTPLVITGAAGFIGRNLRFRLEESGYRDIRCVTRETTEAELSAILDGAGFVYHIAGVNRPKDAAEFIAGNVRFTEQLCSLMGQRGAPSVAFLSSTQALVDNDYGRSKKAAEDLILRYGGVAGPAYVIRLPNVFGKWSRPDYNSAVATFCHNIARDLPVHINDADAPLTLAYIDDVIEQLLGLLNDGTAPTPGLVSPCRSYQTTVGAVVDMIRSFADSRTTLRIPQVGDGLRRALYATYTSFLPPDQFAYSVPLHSDARGAFAEMLKTENSGQMSYFTAHPGVTRGGHYHHTKTEKFLVVQGAARFNFRNIDTNATFSIDVRGGTACIVETVPGWAHSVTNVGDVEMVVLLWANEVFDPERSDTYATAVS
jgi:UDP-2-acetamido-2,6-beta-L-arabino-hexul-4-ose reductase